MAKLNEFNSYEYDPNEIENEIFLSELPLDLFLETIRSQFNEPMEYRKNDYVQSFFNKFYFTKNEMTEDDEEEVEELYTKFVSFMESLFKEYLGIGLPTLEDEGEEEQKELIHYVYRYFIMNIRKNFVNFIYNYIEDRKDGICDSIEKKKDVTSLSLKKNVTDENDITILSNLSEVISDILDEEFTIDDFFKYSRTDSTELEIDFVNDKYENCEITGNFVPYYIKMIDEDLLVEIECKVRNKILKKYKKK